MSRGILVTFDRELEPLAVAKIRKAVAAGEKPDLIILGKRAICPSLPMIWRRWGA